MYQFFSFLINSKVLQFRTSHCRDSPLLRFLALSFITFTDMSFFVLGKKSIFIICFKTLCHITTTVSSPILAKLLFISFSLCTSAQTLCRVTNDKCEVFEAHSLNPFKRHKYLVHDIVSVVPFYFQF